MTTVSQGLRIESPHDLQKLMRADYPLSDQQWAAVTAPLRPTVVIAGAGSGKTTLMAARVVYLVATGAVRPDQVLGLTFTTKAAAELRGRVLASLERAGLLEGDEEGDVLEPHVATYNAYAAELIREQGLRIGHEPDTRVLTDASRYQLGARAVERFRGDIQHLTDHPPTAVQNLLALDGAMAEHLLSADDVRRVDQEARRGFERAAAQEAAGKGRKTYVGPPMAAIYAIDRRAELLGLVDSYRRLKADLGLMDFSDQIALAARLAEEYPEVGAHERSRFAVVLLDEYQDTSVAQTRLLSALFSGPDAERGLGHPVMAVGDPNQAIYGWRGAAASNIVSFPQAFPAPDGPVDVLPLTVNRRSDRRILQVANALAEPLYAALDVVRPLESPPEADEGRVEAHVFESQAEELVWLCDAVRADHEAGTAWSKIAVLTRDNDSGAACFDALSAAGIPVEIVGLAGLLRLPEVAEVVACLTLMQDPLANAALVTLLSGARWSVGPRDLSLLARRARELAGIHVTTTEVTQPSTDDPLVAIADGLDPAEIPALMDALDDPGAAGYSDRAREAFGLLAAELRMLRRSVGEPLLDIVRRVIDTTGIDLELASSTTPAAAARRENLDLFVKSVAEFQSIDGDVSLTALLAYLTAEDEQGNGLDLAVPSEADSVKLLTVHRAKGLEWDSVFIACAGRTRFPSERGRTLWTSSPANIPAPLRGDAADLPQLEGFDKAALDAYRAATKAHEATEELRLGYVALTRAAKHLCFTSHVWGERTTPFGPSDYQRVLKQAADAWGVVAQWAECPTEKTPNPTLADVATPSWPPAARAEESRRRQEAADLVAQARDTIVDGVILDADQQALVAVWDAEIERLVQERIAERSQEIEVTLPASLSATALARLREDAEAFTRDLARPMPRQPSPNARLGTRFHAWVESRFGQLDLLDPDDLPGRGDVGIEDEADLDSLIAAFEAGPFADRTPLAVEAPFSLVLGGHVVRGRIDAVYADGDGYLIVDWKTSRSPSADPVQLALYRLAWAQLREVGPEQVRAAFYYVRSGLVEEPALPDEDELAAALLGAEPL